MFYFIKIESGQKFIVLYRYLITLSFIAFISNKKNYFKDLIYKNMALYQKMTRWLRF